MACSVKTALISLLLYLFIQSRTTEGGRWNLTKEEDMELERQLKILNKPYLKSYKLENGDIFDCVDVYKQPAFDHPLLKNHMIQLSASRFMKNLISEQPRERKLGNFGLKEGCPTGTVPIRRTRKEDLIRAKMYFHDYRIKTSYHTKADIHDGNHYAMIILDDDRRYYGAQALMDVYNLQNVKENQASSAQVILIKGQNGPSNYINTIQFGWNVAHVINGDNQSHLFVHWTSDYYGKTGCFNNLCPGYVQVDSYLAPGMALAPEKRAIKLAVYRDPSTLNWLLKEQRTNVLIGYYPKEIFNNMADVSQVQMGGIVYTPPDEPSYPPMGSGAFPGNSDDACEFKQIGLMNGGGVPEIPNTRVRLYSDTRLYDVLNPVNTGSVDGYLFSFGGPGLA